jgi:hypothetical protein
MKTMTYIDYLLMLMGPYRDNYRGSWKYYKAAIDMVKQTRPKSVLELAPAKQTIIKQCDVMVLRDEDEFKPINPVGRIYVHNATEKPWPIADKQYDLLIALQVWEHLDNKQSRAFREVMRISKAAILSFSYMWVCKKDSPEYPACHMIDEELISDWALNIPARKIVKSTTMGKVGDTKEHIIYYWEF